MEHLRQHSIVHQDIKASNALIDPVTLRVWLIDFGLSSLTCPDSTSTDRIGTPLYMSPQRLQRKLCRPILADLWSVGVLYWQLLLGDHPFSFCNSHRELNLAHQHLSFEGIHATAQEKLKSLLAVDEMVRASWSKALTYFGIGEKVRLDKPVRRRRSKSLTETRPRSEQLA